MLVIFDVDGTLVRTLDLDYRAFAQAFELTFGRPLGDHEYEGSSMSVAARLEGAVQGAFERSPTREERDAVRDASVELVMTHLFSVKDARTVPGAVPAIERLRRAGHRVAFATMDWRPSAEAKLERAGFEIEDIPLAAAEDGPGHAEIITNALQRSGGREVAPHVVYVGSRASALQAARGLGLAVLGVESETHVRSPLGVPNVIRDFEDYHSFEAHLLSSLESG